MSTCNVTVHFEGDYGIYWVSCSCGWLGEEWEKQSAAALDGRAHSEGKHD